MTNTKNNTLNSQNYNSNISMPSTKPNKIVSFKKFIITQFFHHRFLFYMVIAFIIITFSYSILFNIMSNSYMFSTNNTSNENNYATILTQDDQIIYNDNTNLTINGVYYIKNNIIIEILSDNENFSFTADQFVLNIYQPDTLVSNTYNTHYTNCLYNTINNDTNKDQRLIKLMYSVPNNNDNIYTLSILDSKHKTICQTVINSIND